MYVCFREDKSEELRKVHDSKMLYLNKTQTDKVGKVTVQLTTFLAFETSTSLLFLCKWWSTMQKTTCEYCYLQAKEKLTSQTEEWINMVNRQVEEEIGFYEQQAELVSS